MKISKLLNFTAPTERKEKKIPLLIDAVNSINVDCPGEYLFYPSSELRSCVFTSQEIFNNLSIQQYYGELHIELSDKKLVGNKNYQNTFFSIVFDRIDKINVINDKAYITLESIFAKLSHIIMSGSGEINIQGEISSLKIDNQKNGIVFAQNVNARKIFINNCGAGKIILPPTAHLIKIYRNTEEGEVIISPGFTGEIINPQGSIYFK